MTTETSTDPSAMAAAGGAAVDTLDAALPVGMCVTSVMRDADQDGLLRRAGSPAQPLHPLPQSPPRGSNPVAGRSRRGSRSAPPTATDRTPPIHRERRG